MSQRISKKEYELKEQHKSKAVPDLNMYDDSLYEISTVNYSHRGSKDHKDFKLFPHDDELNKDLIQQVNYVGANKHKPVSVRIKRFEERNCFNSSMPLPFDSSHIPSALKLITLKGHMNLMQNERQKQYQQGMRKLRDLDLKQINTLSIIKQNKPIAITHSSDYDYSKATSQFPQFTNRQISTSQYQTIHLNDQLFYRPVRRSRLGSNRHSMDNVASLQVKSPLQKVKYQTLLPKSSAKDSGEVKDIKQRLINYKERRLKQFYDVMDMSKSRKISVENEVPSLKYFKYN